MAHYTSAQKAEWLKRHFVDGRSCHELAQQPGSPAAQSLVNWASAYKAGDLKLPELDEALAALGNDVAVARQPAEAQRPAGSGPAGEAARVAAYVSGMAEIMEGLVKLAQEAQEVEARFRE